jgi:phage tail-like protein
MPYPADIREAYAAGPPLGFRFGVVFMSGGVAPNPLDIRFKRVSGINATITTRSVEEGGQNLYSHRLPEKVQYDNLILERGLVVGSPLVSEVNAAMSLFVFNPANVLVSVLDETGIPITSWLFMKAYPVKWQIADLDADANQVVVETIELTYRRMQTLRI